MTPGRAQRFEQVLVLSLFPAIAWVSVVVFVLAICWDGLSAALVRTFWLGVAVGVLVGMASGSLQTWTTRHRAGARTAAWWLGAGPIVALGMLSIVSPWTYVGLLFLLACLVFGLMLCLPAGLLTGWMVRRFAPRRRGRARWSDE